jgi:hypothetical protein
MSRDGSQGIYLSSINFFFGICAEFQTQYYLFPFILIKIQKSTNSEYFIKYISSI